MTPWMSWLLLLWLFGAVLMLCGVVRFPGRTIRPDDDWYVTELSGDDLDELAASISRHPTRGQR